MVAFSRYTSFRIYFLRSCQQVVGIWKNLEALVIAKDTNQVVINPNVSSLKSSAKESFKMAPALKLTRALRFFNIRLAANLISLRMMLL